jgi:hypothetical protein
METTISVGMWSMKQYSLKGTKTFDEILETVAEINPDKSIDLMEDYVPCHPHTDMCELVKLKKRIESFGLIINSNWFYTDLIGKVHVESFDKVVNDLKEYILVVATLGAKFMNTPLDCPLLPGMSYEEGYELVLKIYEEIIPVAEEYNVIIGIDGGLPGFCSPRTALKLVKDLGSDYLTVTPDFEAWRTPSEDIPGLFIETADSEKTEGLSIDVFEDCLPYSPLIHAKFLSFDKKGEEPNFPIAEMMSLVKKSNREHTFVIEYEGWIPDINPHLDPATETKKGIDLLKRYLV